MVFTLELREVRASFRVAIWVILLSILITKFIRLLSKAIPHLDHQSSYSKLLLLYVWREDCWLLLDKGSEDPDYIEAPP